MVEMLTLGGEQRESSVPDKLLKRSSELEASAFRSLGDEFSSVSLALELEVREVRNLYCSANAINELSEYNP